jgi:hypothetical protein
LVVERIANCQSTGNPFLGTKAFDKLIKNIKPAS